ncbi:MAG: tetraacyldisaccharide 4'-kinase [Planctomycetes bacterium]|nr:tetraacyldisaccharide 4'-kinase [Planctomycetota bacterium]
MTTCCTSYRRVISGDSHGLGASLARGALGVLSVPYGWATSFRDMYNSGGAVAVGLPVISVGNITAGGTGKTPVVSLVVSEMKKRGLRPVILSRGHAADDTGMNDEARLLEREHPGVLHLQGKDRLALAQRAAKSMLGDVIVLDDGFQVLSLHRDLNVCCIDATNPFGYGSVLPRGLLREPLSSLYRARPVLITRAELSTPERIAEIRAEILRWNEHARIVVSEMKCATTSDVNGGSTTDATELAGKRVLCVSGIGNPDAFEANVRTTGARVGAHVEMDDHHAWTAADVKSVAARASEVAAEVVVTTSKDAVKLAALAWPQSAPPLRILDVKAVITGDADVWTRLIDEALARK